MKSRFYLPLLLLTSFIAIFSISGFRSYDGNEPWTAKQLLAPEDLARIINDPTAKQPIIFSIGPAAIIKNSIDIGSVKEKENLDKLKEELKALSRDADIVIYCGCCPFEHCPNIRPVFKLLNKMKFTNHKLLNLEHNIKMDWLNKNYPVAQHQGK
jgi:thiosulfate/3-mercaptopyruvate sulfurtransferase